MWDARIRFDFCGRISVLVVMSRVHYCSISFCFTDSQARSHCNVSLQDGTFTGAIQGRHLFGHRYSIIIVERQHRNAQKKWASIRVDNQFVRIDATW
jgi:hypothetical protein